METNATGWRGWLVRALLLALLLVLLRTDAHHLSPATASASAHLFALEEWIVENMEDKWRHKVRRLLPVLSLSREEQIERMEELFEIQVEVRSIRRDVARAAACVGHPPRPRDPGQPRTPPVDAPPAPRGPAKRRGGAPGERACRRHRGGRAPPRLQARSGPSSPPSTFASTPPPRSSPSRPRDRIRLSETVLLDSDVEVAEREAVEETLAAEHNLSALVLPIAGLAAYPAIVSGTRDLRRTLEIVAHEWLHQYWFFYPLGFNYFASAEMTTLNETAADIAGRELGDLAYERLTGIRPPPPAAPSPTASDERAFDFGDEMRETRRTADALLAQGLIDEAEWYMEQRRRLFVDNGYAIRVLNQAYFAFHGTYAESPASVSPIAGQLHDLRERSASLGEFIRTVARFDTYDAFLAYLGE